MAKSWMINKGLPGFRRVAFRMQKPSEGLGVCISTALLLDLR